MTLNVARPDGNAIAVDIIGRSVRDPQSGELEIVSVAREATERLRAESALATAEERFRELVEWLPAVVYEADTGPDGAFHYVSPQITELLGYSRGRVDVGPDALASAPACRRARSRCSSSNGSTSRRHAGRATGSGSEYRMMHRSGRTVWVRDIARL